MLVYQQVEAEPPLWSGSSQKGGSDSTTLHDYILDISSGNPDPSVRRSGRRSAEDKPAAATAGSERPQPSSATMRVRPDTAARRSIRKESQFQSSSA